MGKTKKSEEKTVKIKWLQKKTSLSQTHSDTGLEFCFLSSKNEQVHQFATCKDFLHDAVFGHITKKPINVWNFKYNAGSDLPLSTRKMRMLITTCKETTGKSNLIGPRLEGMLDFMHQLEDVLKIKTKTAAYVCEDPPANYKTGVWLLESNARWLRTPVMVSLYSLMVRVGLGHKAGVPYNDTLQAIIKNSLNPYESKDKSQLQSSIKGIELILKSGDKVVFPGTLKDNFPDGLGAQEMHNYCGIVAFSSGNLDKRLPYNKELAKEMK